MKNVLKPQGLVKIKASSALDTYTFMFKEIRANLITVHGHYSCYSKNGFKDYAYCAVPILGSRGVDQVINEKCYQGTIFKRIIGK